jgi:hypothetical protein
MNPLEFDFLIKYCCPFKNILIINYNKLAANSATELLSDFCNFTCPNNFSFLDVNMLSGFCRVFVRCTHECCSFGLDDKEPP